MRKIIIAIAFILLASVSVAASPSHISGALWWVDPAATKPQLSASLDAQQAAGFDTLWMFALDQMQASDPAKLDWLLGEADRRLMRVIVGIPSSPNWWVTLNPSTEINLGSSFVKSFYKAYKKHICLYAWYLNYEVYYPGTAGSSSRMMVVRPMMGREAILVEPPAKTTSSRRGVFATISTYSYLSQVWTGLVSVSKITSPSMLVSLSPFFLLDSQGIRGFPYYTPSQYQSAWGAIIKQTGINLVMQQDSGEHLSFFTIADRQPFWQAMKAACTTAKAHYWLNIELGQCNVASWSDYAAILAAEGHDPLNDAWRWSAVPGWFRDQKIAAGASLAEDLVSWGWFEYPQ